MYHHKRDSGICLEDELDEKPVQPQPQRHQNFDDSLSRNEDEPSVPATADTLPQRWPFRGMHFTQLTESEWTKFFDGSVGLTESDWALPILSDERKPKVLSGYPIPYNFNILTPPNSQTGPLPREQSSTKKSSCADRFGTEGRKRQVIFHEDYEFLHNGGMSPADEENLHSKFPAEFEREALRQLRRHAATLRQELEALYRHQDDEKPVPCDRILPSILVTGPKKK